LTAQRRYVAAEDSIATADEAAAWWMSKLRPLASIFCFGRSHRIGKTYQFDGRGIVLVTPGFDIFRDELAVPSELDLDGADIVDTLTAQGLGPLTLTSGDLVAFPACIRLLENPKPDAGAPNISDWLVWGRGGAESYVRCQHGTSAIHTSVKASRGRVVAPQFTGSLARDRSLYGPSESDYIRAREERLSNVSAEVGRQDAADGTPSPD
jgi:hypothetical protein